MARGWKRVVIQHALQHVDRRGVHAGGPEFTAGTPKALFPLKAAPVFSPNTVWQPMCDGQRQRVLVLRPAEPAQGKPITIVTNWRGAEKIDGHQFPTLEVYLAESLGHVSIP